MNSNKEMAWVGEKNSFPGVEDEGFEEFEFSHNQIRYLVAMAREEARIENTVKILKTLSNLQMENEKDTIIAVAAVANACGVKILS